MAKAGEGTIRKERARHTRQEILDRALELFQLHGYEATSLEAIVRAAGVSKGAFYAHFTSKVSLIHEYLGTLDLDYRRYYATIPEHGDPSAILAGFADSVAATLETRLGLDLLRAVYRAEIAHTIPLDPFVSRNRELYRVFGEILESGKRSGTFRPGLDVARVSDHLVMSIRSMVFEWCVRAPGFELRKELAAHIALLMDGLCKIKATHSQ
jgi:AcrR family transcriptional regulator